MCCSHGAVRGEVTEAEPHGVGQGGLVVPEAGTALVCKTQPHTSVPDSISGSHPAPFNLLSLPGEFFFFFLGFCLSCCSTQCCVVLWLANHWFQWLSLNRRNDFLWSTCSEAPDTGLNTEILKWGVKKNPKLSQKLQKWISGVCLPTEYCNKNGWGMC